MGHQLLSSDHYLRYSMLEDNIHVITQTVMITNQPNERNKPSGKKPPESKEGRSKDQKGSRDQSQKQKSSHNSPTLNVSYERLLPIIRDLLEFKWFAPIQMDP